MITTGNKTIPWAGEGSDYIIILDNTGEGREYIGF